MSLLDRVFGFAKQVVELAYKTENLSKNVEKLTDEVQKLNERMARIELIAELGVCAADVFDRPFSSRIIA